VTAATVDADRPIRLGVSSCLLGEQVRYDGGHKRNRFVTDALGDYFRWVRVCPEVGAGLGVPRESFRLSQTEDSVRMIGNRSGNDVTEAVSDYSSRHVESLAPQRLRGFILKNNSPTCGMERVRVYDRNSVPKRIGTGVYARRLMERYPHLPVEEEGRLEDPRIRENFITRVFALDRWIGLVQSRPGPREIVSFHTSHKMLLLAHSPKHYRAAGRIVADAGVTDMDELTASYEAALLEGLRRIASPGRHVNVMQHLAGFVKNDLGGEDTRELHTLFEDYKAERVPLVAPLTLLRHHLRHLKDDWIDVQVYLNPYPFELALRSSI